MKKKAASAPAAHPSVLPSSPEALAQLRSTAPAWYQKPRSNKESIPSEKDKEYRGAFHEYPPVTVIALGTRAGDDTLHYRVGAVTNRDFAQGLHLDDGSLNPKVALRCFGTSPVYTEEEAETAACALYWKTFNEVTRLSTSERLHRLGGRSGDEYRPAEEMAEVDARRQVCGIKILHLSCAWPH